MTIETVHHIGEPPVPFLTKLNPIWWLHGDDGWNVPEINNGAPYLPEVENIWLRRFYWFVCRNPLMNFVGLVMGVGDREWDATGVAPVDATTGRDARPKQQGWRWAVLYTAWSWPSVAVWGVSIGLGLLWWPFFAITPFAFFKAIGALPYVSYFGNPYEKWVEFYLGWRPYSGGFGTKLVFPKEP